MSRSARQLGSRPTLKIVDSPQLIAGSPEAIAIPDERDSNVASDGTLSVPSSAGEFLEASVAEDGGPARIGTRRGSQHQYRAVLHEAIVRVAGALDREGVCDKNGRLRRSWLTELQGLIREARSIDEMLGLPKKASESVPVAGQRRSANAVGLPADSTEHLPAEIEDFFDRMDFEPVADGD
jgi:hypothetical protein